MWNSIGKKKNKRVQQQTRQHQKIRTRTIIVLAATSLACISVVVTLFFHFSRIDQSSAIKVQVPAAAYMIEDNSLHFSKKLSEPVLKNIPVIGPNTILTRSTKIVTPVTALPGN